MHTSIVIPLIESRWNDNELRYCLRGIEKHLIGYHSVIIVGHRPTWIKNVVHLPFKDSDKSYNKEANIFNKIILACENEAVSDRFLFMNDDHFLTAPFNAEDFPNLHGGEFTQRTDLYGQTIENTIAILSKEFFASNPNGFKETVVPVFNNYDIHCPMVFEKDLFYKLQKFDWKKKGGYCMKTLYCYENKRQGVYYPDLKITGDEQIKLATGRAFFSISESMRTPNMQRLLSELYPNKSYYE